MFSLSCGVLGSLDFSSLFLELFSEAGTAPGGAVTFCLRAKSHQKRAFNTSGRTRFALRAPLGQLPEISFEEVVAARRCARAGVLAELGWATHARCSFEEIDSASKSKKSRSTGTPASREVARCPARAQQRAEHTSYENSDSRRLPERRAQRKASSAAGIQKRIFGDFLGKTKKLLRRRAELPASGSKHPAAPQKSKRD
ncbi:hypothetical protein [Diaphorobacter caeni]|uniref:hypothetical protein n=1 Tax=Diaphorobacter caeni TaxID=2784387 RepID=UPI00188F049D|nr:hypothetical protein [Diaphorobacter caeni]MBF5007030.1 hypothetical protein [Diaphorobacter caeni]